MNQPPVLECRSVSKRFGGLDALDGVNFRVAEGQVYGVIGPNGAGKTTLFDVISGVASPSSGTIHFLGRDITRASAPEIARLGLQRTFQTPVSFHDMSVRDNVVVGAMFGGQDRIGGGEQALQSHVEQVIEFCQLTEVRALRAGPLAVLHRKQLMIASALAAKPRLLMLDEPIGGLNHDERELMLGVLRRINELGMSLLIIEHVMSALMQIAREVLILDQGKVIFEGSPGEAVKNPEVVRVYLGAEADRLSNVSSEGARPTHE